MPYKSEKIKIEGTLLDRRRKISEEEKEIIIDKYRSGNYSHQSLAIEYNVSKSLIGIIVNKDRALRVKERIKEHWAEYALTREERATAIRKTRRYKQSLYLREVIK